MPSWGKLADPLASRASSQRSTGASPVEGIIMTKDALGERMKGFEKAKEPKLDSSLPIIVRIDGKAFHTFTKGLKRPYDESLSKLMVETTKFLVEETNARIGYTQSDEISLVFYPQSEDSYIFFDGKFSKMTSIIASLTTYFFNKNLITYLSEKKDKYALFDCRVFNVPSKDEAVNCLIWRELDARKNSISMAAQSVYSHKELLNKTSQDKLKMLEEKGINWHEYPMFFKHGTYIQRVKKFIKFSTEELERLPEKHEARKNPDLTIERQVVEVLALEFPLIKYDNKIEMVFEGEAPHITHYLDEYINTKSLMV